MSIASAEQIIDAFENGKGVTPVESRWRLVSDQEMGGVSGGRNSFSRHRRTDSGPVPLLDRYCLSLHFK